MKIKILILGLSLISLNVFAQVGAAKFSALSNHSYHTPNGNGNLGQTFNMTACGLNYTAGSVRIETRDNYQTVYSYHLGNGFPDSLLINNVVGGCNTIVKAFLYWSESYYSGTLPNQTVIFRNPLGTVDSVAGSYIGVGGNKCWGEVGSYAFRVDVTPYIIANGYYNMMNVLGVANPSREVDGFTLLVIYQDASASYEGTLVIDDGANTVDGGAALGNVTNFTVCGNPVNERGFVIASDLQDNLTGDSIIINGTTLVSPQDFWEDDDYSTIYLTGQTTSEMGASSTNDCFMIIAEGVYYQTTCLGCMPSALQVNLAAINTSCDTSQLGNASINITSGSPPYTINWSTGATNVTSINNLNAGNYSVTITDAHGCSTVLNFSIGVGVSNLTFTNAGCPNFNNGTATASPSGNGPYSFEWSTGATTNSISGLTAGTYYITITDGSQCSWIDSVTITGTAAPNPSIIGQSDICQGDSTVLSVGNYLSYIWNTGATTNSINVNASGTYCVTVSTGNSCTGTACFTVTVNPSPNPLITQIPTSVCGSGIVMLNAGAGYSSYSWNTGASSQTINPFVSSDTSFRVIVTNSSGCSGSATFNISVFHAIDLPVIIHGTTTICPGDTVDLLVRNSVTGGGYASYLWTNGGTDQMDTAVIPTSSPYCVTVTDSNGCTAVTCINITILPPPSITLTHNGPQNLCGSGPITLNAGAWSSYLWNTGATTDSINVSTVGMYCVTITDSSGCTGSACINVTTQMLTSPNISANGPTTFCEGDSISLDAGQYNSFVWSTGSTAETITVSASGTYCVTASGGANGCTGTACINITVNPNPVPMILSSFGNNFCGHGTAFLNTSSPYSSYLWNNGSTNSFINENDTTTTTYTVTVTDNNGCTGTTSLIITVYPATPAPIINSNATAVCNGDSATLIVTGGNYSSFLWNNGATTDTLIVTTGGYYYVTVTGNDGCTAMNNIYIYPTPTVFFFNANSSDLCSDSSRILTANPSEQASSYLWSTGETTQSITIYHTGIYTVTITGQNSGCTASASIDITTISLVIIPSGPTTFCQGSYVNLSPGANYYSWVWSDGSTNNSLDAFTTGTYCVTVTDFSGCNATACIDVTVNPNPTPTITGASTICNGDSISLNAGSYSTYNWSTNDTAETISITNAGNYSVTVTDTNGCTGMASIHINSSMNPTLTITPSGPTTVCNGDSVNLDAGNYDFNTNTYYTSYTWTNGTTSEVISATTGGIYCVTVSNIYGCTSSSCITITNGIISCSITPNGPTIFCEGDSVILDAGTWSHYNWSSGATTETITVTSSGSYCVIVSDNNDCTCVACIDIQVTGAPISITCGNTINVSNDTDSCNAFICIELPAITGCGNLTISESANNNVILNYSNGQECGTYPIGTTTLTWTVTDSQGNTASCLQTVTVNDTEPPTIICPRDYANCTKHPDIGTPQTHDNCGIDTVYNNAPVHFGYGTTVVTWTTIDIHGNISTCAQNVTISDSVNPLITPNGPVNFCFGDSVTLDAGVWRNYRWNTGDTTETITVTASGIYCVTVNSFYGCTGSACITVNVTNNLACSITPNNSTTFCSGDSVALDAGLWSSYLWNNGSTVETLTASSTGTYCVTIMDVNGCSCSSCINVTANNNPTCSITPDGPTTFNQGGSVTLDAGMWAGYLWNTGQSTETINADTSGTYCVTITDSNGCTCVACIVITVISNNCTITPNGSTTICQGDSVLLTASTASNYLWNTGSTDETITVSTSGTYCITVTYSNNSTCTACIDITVNPNPIPIITASGPTTFCQGDSVLLDAGIWSSYLWNIGSVSETIIVTLSGSYSITVTDANGCTGVAIQDVNVYPAFTDSIIPSGQTTFCQGDSVSLDAGSYTSYSWATGETTETITAFTTGTYRVTVTNANACTAMDTINITMIPFQNTAITSSGPLQFCSGDSVTLTEGSYTSYEWNTGDTGQSITTDTSGTYIVTVTSASGCSGTDQLTVTVYSLPIPTIIPNGPTAFCNGDTVNLTVSPSFASYLWNTATSAQTIPVSSSGNYTVTVTNTNGCTGTASLIVTVYNHPTPVITTIGSTNFCQGGFIILNAGSWTSYSWSDGATTQTIAVTASGNYCATVTDSNGCTGSACITVIAYSSPVPVIIPNGPTTFCPDDSVILNVGSWSSYTWNNSATTAAITVHATGDYCVTVTDSNGCTAVACQQVNVITVVPVNITEFCHGDLIRLVAGSFATYLWNTGATTDTIYATTSGSYSVFITTGTGCTGTDTASITVYPHMNPPVITGPTSVCDGDTITLCTQTYTSYNWSTGATASCITATTTNTYYVTVSNGGICNYVTHQSLSFLPNPVPAILQTGSFCNNGFTTIKTGATFASYNWSNGATTQATNVNTAGTYSVTVTSINGCTGTASVTLTNVCDIPSNLFTNNIGSSYGMANWTQPTCHYNYTIRISLHNLNTWTTHIIAANTHYTFSSLTSSTTYDWQIRNNCDSSQSNVSSFSATQVFTTLAHRDDSDNGISSFEVYPNPAYDHVIVTFNSENDDNFKIRLMDITGRIILNNDFQATKGENQTELNLTPIAKGVYFMVLEKGEMILQTKLVIE